jgi:hypothetical protein
VVGSTLKDGMCRLAKAGMKDRQSGFLGDKRAQERPLHQVERALRARCAVPLDDLEEKT